MQQRTIQVLSISLFVALLFWGVYTLLYYIGVPVHVSVLVPDAAKTAIDSACTQGGYLCRGFHVLVPFITNTIARASEPLLAYYIISAILFGLFVGLMFLKNEKSDLQFRLTPWKVVLLFAASLWLFFMTLAYGDGGGSDPLRLLYEPLPQVYVNAGEEGLAQLKANFEVLQSEGCLREVGMTNHGAKVFHLTGFCMQKYFFVRVISQLLFILFILFDFLVLGRSILQLVRVRSRTLFIESLLSVGLGACGVIILLWLVAVISLFTVPLYIKGVGWAMMFAIPLLGFKSSWYWIQKFLWSSADVRQSWHSIVPLLAWFLLSYLAFNFLAVVRPFPIGWDDLGSYLNRPRLLVSYGHFISPMSRFGWEYLTSLGYLLFGYESTFGATASMMINWAAGLLATLTVYVFASTFLGRGRGLIAALLYYTLPLVGHFSFADMKIDNAVFMTGALSMFCLFLYLFPTHDEADSAEPPLLQGKWVMLALAGIFSGFVFAMKSTGIMVLLASGTVLLGALVSPLAFVSSLFFVVMILTQQEALKVSFVLTRIGLAGDAISKNTLVVICGLIGLAMLTFALYLKRDKAVPMLKSAGIFILFFLLSVAPWIVHNNIQYGRPFSLAITLDAPNKLVPSMDFEKQENVQDFGQDIRYLPDDLAVDMNNAACKSTGSTEELDRYWGFESGWRHFLTLPWRTVMNLDSAGYYVTTIPVLLLFPLLLLLPYFWSKKGRWLRWMFLGTVVLLVEWIFLANGIPWYGIGVFLGLVIGIEALAARAPDLWSRILMGFLITCSLLISINMRFWQFEQQRNMFEYPMGKVTAEALEERTIAFYDDVADIVTDRHRTMPDRPYVYRVGTFIPYFIPRNLEVIGHGDHQLDFFNCLYQERNPALTLKRLQALGFNSIIFDTNTATIERDVNGTLHKKVDAFVGFLNNASLGIQIIVNDPGSGIAFVLLP